MQRPWLFAPLVGLLASVVVAPIFATAALAADPSVTVKPGDTLTSISKRHRVSIATLVDLNELSNPNRIYAGQRLRLAAKTAKAAKPSKTVPAEASKPEGERTHVVKQGQHLTGIARRYGVTVSAMVRANEITNASRIYAGQRLTIPDASGSAAPRATKATKPAASATHKVAPGENLTTIARKHGVSVSALVQANGITNPSRIYAGQRLTLPGKSAAPTNGSMATGSEGATMPASIRALMAKRDGIRRIIVEEARRYDVPAALALAVAWQESGWQQGVVSPAGAVGVMQLMPATAEWVGDVMLGTPVKIRDTRHNVRAGVRLLAHYLARYDDDRARVLAAYYQGQSATDRHGVFPVSRPYITSIKVLERLFGD
ncbi:MAG: LysM peptidoglycan-binding domain-containing protein [Chloroflexota bacterium]|nr:LysM peptidoglycan-binding domain-containing protein [Chloroflexota bacterium]